MSLLLVMACCIWAEVSETIELGNHHDRVREALQTIKRGNLGKGPNRGDGGVVKNDKNLYEVKCQVRNLCAPPPLPPTEWTK